jgi:hypothetical protein
MLVQLVSPVGVAIAMIEIMRLIPLLLTSPKWPKIRPPKGRAMKPTA